jgi:hypothetical protein
MDSDEDKFYKRMFDFDVIYNFVVQIFFNWRHLHTQNLYNDLGLFLQIFLLGTIIFFLKS